MDSYNQSTTLTTTPWLDISAIVDNSEDDSGLHSLAFSPVEDRVFFGYDTASSFVVGNEYLDGAGDPTGERYVTFTLAYDADTPSHRGGRIRFDEDGYLYIILGDGGAPTIDEPFDAQDTAKLVGKILRVNPTGQNDTYSIPSNNPFSASGEEDLRTEIYAVGFRNPRSGELARVQGSQVLVVADSGDNVDDEFARQEINFVRGGNNYGWPLMEGVCGFYKNRQGCFTPDVSDPDADYAANHGVGIRGAVVLSGDDYPAVASDSLLVVDRDEGAYFVEDGTEGFELVSSCETPALVLGADETFSTLGREFYGNALATVFDSNLGTSKVLQAIVQSGGACGACTTLSSSDSCSITPKPSYDALCTGQALTNFDPDFGEQIVFILLAMFGLCGCVGMVGAATYRFYNPPPMNYTTFNKAGSPLPNVPKELDPKGRTRTISTGAEYSVEKTRQRISNASGGKRGGAGQPSERPAAEEPKAESPASKAEESKPAGEDEVVVIGK